MRPTRVEIERVYFALVRDELDCFLCVIEFESKRNALLLLLLLKRSHTTTGIIEQNAMAVEKKRRRDKKERTPSTSFGAMTLTIRDEWSSGRARGALAVKNEWRILVTPNASSFPLLYEERSLSLSRARVNHDDINKST
mgnify:CR=1